MTFFFFNGLYVRLSLALLAARGSFYFALKLERGGTGRD